MNIPKIVGFIIAGVIIGPSVLGVVSEEFLRSSNIIIDIALSFIAFMIGGSLKWNRIKNLGKTILKISLLEAEGAFLFTSAGLYLMLPFMMDNITSLQNWQFYLILSLFLGAIATATAPGAVLATIHEMGAKGKFTTTLLAVVAIDDSLALFNFILVVVILSFILGTDGSSITGAIDRGLYEIFFSFLIGIFTAALLIVLEKNMPSKSSKIIVAFSAMMLAFGAAKHFELNGLLCAMVLGIVFANFSESFDFVYEEMSIHFENIIFLFFFILSGAHLDFSILITIPVIVIVYILLRISGKITGSYIGATLSNEDKNIRKYFGLALFPQAGVSIGLALSLISMPQLEQIGNIVLSVVIATTAVNEMVGPFLVKYALKKAGEC